MIIATLALVCALIRIGHAHKWTEFDTTKAEGNIYKAKLLWDSGLTSSLYRIKIALISVVGGCLFTRPEDRSAHTVEEQRAQDAAL